MYKKNLFHLNVSVLSDYSSTQTTRSPHPQSSPQDGF